MFLFFVRCFLLSNQPVQKLKWIRQCFGDQEKCLLNSVLLETLKYVIEIGYGTIIHGNPSNKVATLCTLLAMKTALSCTISV